MRLPRLSGATIDTVCPRQDSAESDHHLESTPSRPREFPAQFTLIHPRNQASGSVPGGSGDDGGGVAVLSARGFFPQGSFPALPEVVRFGFPSFLVARRNPAIGAATDACVERSGATVAQSYGLPHCPLRARPKPFRRVSLMTLGELAIGTFALPLKPLQMPVTRR